MPKTAARTLMRSGAFAPKLRIDDHIFYLIGQIYSSRAQAMAQLLRPTGMTYNAWKTLFWLSDRAGSTLKEIADATVVDRTTLSRTVERVIANGLVRRRVRASDKRHGELFLTARGRRVFATLVPFSLAQNGIAVRGLSGADVDVLLRTLRLLVGNLRATGETQPARRAQDK